MSVPQRSTRRPAIAAAAHGSAFLDDLLPLPYSVDQQLCRWLLLSLD